VSISVSFLVLASGASWHPSVRVALCVYLRSIRRGDSVAPTVIQISAGVLCIGSMYAIPFSSHPQVIGYQMHLGGCKAPPVTNIKRSDFCVSVCRRLSRSITIRLKFCDVVSLALCVKIRLVSST
jgi:hypothetical protein